MTHWFGTDAALNKLSCFSHFPAMKETDSFFVKIKQAILNIAHTLELHNFKTGLHLDHPISNQNITICFFLSPFLNFYRVQ